MSIERPVHYQHGGTTHHGFVAIPDSGPGPFPCIVIAHAFRGQGEFERDRARELAKLGFVGFAYDMYGEGLLHSDPADARNEMQKYTQDRELLRSRFAAAIDAARGLEQVDAGRIGAIGYCFGGLCVLELARSGADVLGVASFHGMLHTPFPAEPGAVRASVLVLHGWDDPMAPPEHVTEFAEEMTNAGADWQLHAYGNVMHAFTNPAANAPKAGLNYDAKADARSWASMLHLFETLFQD